MRESFILEKVVVVIMICERHNRFVRVGKCDLCIEEEEKIKMEIVKLEYEISKLEKEDREIESEIKWKY